MGKTRRITVAAMIFGIAATGGIVYGKIEDKTPKLVEVYRPKNDDVRPPILTDEYDFYGDKDIKIYRHPIKQDIILQFKGDYVILIDRDRDGTPDMIISADDIKADIKKSSTGFKSLEDTYEALQERCYP